MANQEQASAKANSVNETALFSASYASPTNVPFTVTETLVPAKPGDVDDKSRYLNDLRKAVAAVQQHVNKELTLRMEEDNKKKAGGQAAAATDDVKAEENYGEEVVDEED